MDYQKAARQVLENVGGASNIVSAAHCATRLRLVIADNSLVNKAALENAEGAKGVFEAQGQLQIIFGTGVVNKVYPGTNGPAKPWATSLFPSSPPLWPPVSSWASWKHSTSW